MVKTCTSCNKPVLGNFVEFPCPKCLKVIIVRCPSCRSAVREYKCSECGFIGP